MRAVVQRVTRGRVLLRPAAGEPHSIEHSAIEQGLVVLLGVGKGDREADADWLAEKLVNLRIFEDEAGKMNKSLLDVGGSLLLVSQFTLYGDCRKGRRPGFDQAAPPEEAKRLYEYMAGLLRGMVKNVGTGVFQADMLVDIANDGPVTMLLDSNKIF